MVYNKAVCWAHYYTAHKCRQQQPAAGSNHTAVFLCQHPLTNHPHNTCSLVLSLFTSAAQTLDPRQTCHVNILYRQKNFLLNCKQAEYTSQHQMLFSGAKTTQQKREFSVVTLFTPVVLYAFWALKFITYSSTIQKIIFLRNHSFRNFQPNTKWQQVKTQRFLSYV